jgi:hypothetical protein
MVEEATGDLSPRKLEFPNNNTAISLDVPDGVPAEEITRALGIEKPEVLILLMGGAARLEEETRPRVLQLFSRGLVRAVGTRRGILMDGGTRAGIMEITGQAVADNDRKTPLLGVAPKGKITFPGDIGRPSGEAAASLDMNHSHFVLVDSDEWGGETATLFRLAGWLSEGIPVLGVLVNGGDITRREVLTCVRRKWPVLVLKGSGRLADQIAEKWEASQKSDGGKQPYFEDPDVAEIVADGDIYCFPGDGSPHDLYGLIISTINPGRDDVLASAWKAFAEYDANAIHHQRRSKVFQTAILGLGVLATFLVLLLTQMKTGGVETILEYALRYAILGVSIVTTFMIALANRHKPGIKWVVLRASAEAIKREIYKFRTRPARECRRGFNRRAKASKIERRQLLARRVAQIRQSLMQTEANMCCLRPHKGSLPPDNTIPEADDGFSCLSPQEYIRLRLEDQLDYYKRKACGHERILKILQVAIYAFSGAGTLLAAIGRELWVPLAASLAGALSSYIWYRQIESTVRTYNQAAADLAGVRDLWETLPEAKKEAPQQVASLVDETEAILESEHVGWVQRMQDALARLREKWAESETGQEGGEQT